MFYFKILIKNKGKKKILKVSPAITVNQPAPLILMPNSIPTINTNNIQTIDTSMDSKTLNYNNWDPISSNRSYEVKTIRETLYPEITPVIASSTLNKKGELNNLVYIN